MPSRGRAAQTTLFGNGDGILCDHEASSALAHLGQQRVQVRQVLLDTLGRALLGAPEVYQANARTALSARRYNRTKKRLRVRITGGSRNMT